MIRLSVDELLKMAADVAEDENFEGAKGQLHPIDAYAVAASTLNAVAIVLVKLSEAVPEPAKMEES